MKKEITYSFRICIRLCIVMASAGVATAQSTNEQLLPAGIQSPTAASLGKFGDIPVSLYTGVPNITIPLHQITGRKLSLPLQLKYHASGVKVREIAGWVGLGWALDAGGVITRSVSGLIDEAPYGYLETQDSLKAVWEGTSTTLSVLLKVEEDGVDPEPDMFFYNFAGRSGKFVLSDENMTSTTIQGKPISDTNIDIEMIQTTGCGINGDCKFEVTVEDGTK